MRPASGGLLVEDQYGDHRLLFAHWATIEVVVHLLGAYLFQYFFSTF
jgi:hypothetical protein